MVLKKGICQQCFKKRHRIVDGMLPVHHTVDEVVELFDIYWKHHKKCLCYFSKTGFHRSVKRLPPSDCPYLVEHAVNTRQRERMKNVSDWC